MNISDQTLNQLHRISALRIFELGDSVSNDSTFKEDNHERD